MNPQPRPIGTPYQLAGDQIREALHDLEISHDDFPPPPWGSLTEATGPLFPGSLWVIGGRFGMGKTAFLTYWFSSLFRKQRRVLYIATETPPKRLRRQLAAMHCDLNKKAVLANDWKALPKDAKRNVIADLQQQHEWENWANYFHATSLDRPTLNEAYKVAKRMRAEVILLDHVNRYRGERDVTRELSNLAADMTEAARKLQACIVVAQQITPWGKDHANPLTEFAQPPLSALKGTQAFAQEAQTVLMLHRARKNLPRDEAAELMHKIMLSQAQARDLIDPGIMCVSIVKDREGDMTGRTIRLRVHPTGWIEEA